MDVNDLRQTADQRKQMAVNVRNRAMELAIASFAGGVPDDGTLIQRAASIEGFLQNGADTAKQAALI